MIFGWSKKLWILSYLTNWTRKLSRTILFFSITFSPTIIPVHISRAKNTLPNLPYPNLLIILKQSLESPSFDFLNFGGDLVWLLRKDGKVLSDLYVTSPSVLVVDDVSLRMFALPPDPRGPKNVGCFSFFFELLFSLAKIYELKGFSIICLRWISSGGCSWRPKFWGSLIF